MSVYVDTVVLDARDMKRATTFWASALGYALVDEREDWAKLTDPEGRGVSIALQPNPDEKTDVNRVHLDLNARDVDAEIARLEALGAKRIPWEYPPDETRYVVLVDTEGNEFCVVRDPNA